MLSGIDIGGTSIKYGFVEADGTIVEQHQVPTLAHEGREAVLARIVDIARTLALDRPSNRAIGIGVPGVVDPVTRHVQSPPNLPGWDDVPLQQIVADAVGVRVTVENDANAGAIAELRAGAGKGLTDFLYITLGTGVGGGVVIGGSLYTGPHGDAGEVGHLHIEPGTVLEKVIGRVGILKRYGAGDTIDVSDIDQRAVAGEQQAIDVLTETGRLLGIGLCSALAVLGLRTVIVGGGISRSTIILDTARETVRTHAIPTIARTATIVPAHFLHDAGLVGAAMLCSE
jgi:glucokinase